MNRIRLPQNPVKGLWRPFGTHKSRDVLDRLSN